MGGAAFIPAGALSALAATGFSHPVVYALALTTLCFTCIGAYDDVQKLRGKSNYTGLSPRAKLALQCLVSAAFCAWLALFGGGVSTSLNLAGLGLGRLFAGLGLAAAAIPIGGWFWALSAFAMAGRARELSVFCFFCLTHHERLKGAATVSNLTHHERLKGAPTGFK